MAAANALFAAEKYAEAVEPFRAITEAQPQNGEAWFKLGYCLHATGRLDEALVAHAKAAEFPDYRAAGLYNLGCAHALKGNADAAFEALNKSIDSGFTELQLMLDDPDLKSLHADARWKALVERLQPKAT
jgi:Flp pilus assembly protein TadD